MAQLSSVSPTEPRSEVEGTEDALDPTSVAEGEPQLKKLKPAVVQKKPSTMLKRPAASNGSGDGEAVQEVAGKAEGEEEGEEDDKKGEDDDEVDDKEDDEEDDEEDDREDDGKCSKTEDDVEPEQATPKKPTSAAGQARASMKAVEHKQREIEKCEALKVKLSQRAKGVNSELASLRSELESLEAEARRHARSATQARNEQEQERAGKKASDVKKAQVAAAVHVKVVKSRVDFLKAICEKLRDGADRAEGVLGEAKVAMRAAEQQCSALKDAGHEVPDDGDSSSTTALHPEAIMASKTRFRARAKLAKASAAYEKAATPANAKREALRIAEEKLEAAKQRRKTADEELQASGCLASPARASKARSSPIEAKAKTKTQNKVKAKAMANKAIPMPKVTEKSTGRTAKVKAKAKAKGKAKAKPKAKAKAKTRK